MKSREAGSVAQDDPSSAQPSFLICQGVLKFNGVWREMFQEIDAPLCPRKLCLFH